MFAVWEMHAKGSVLHTLAVIAQKHKTPPCEPEAIDPNAHAMPRHVYYAPMVARTLFVVPDQGPQPIPLVTKLVKIVHTAPQAGLELSSVPAE